MPGVEAVSALRLRWVGHRLHADARLTVDRELSLSDAHHLAEQAAHAVVHDVPRLADVVVHTDPCSHDGSDPHADTRHHQSRFA